MAEQAQQEAETSNRITVGVKEIFAWCQVLTGESRKDDHPYLWPESVRRLALTLELSSRGIYALNGWLGVGKSQAMLALSDELSAKKIRTLYVKVQERAGLIKSIRREYGELLPKYEEDFAWNEFVDAIRDPRLRLKLENARFNSNSKGQRDFMMAAIKQEKKPFAIDLDLIYRFLPKETVGKIKEEAFKQFLKEFRVLLIDLPDYPRGGKQAMSMDLDNIQKIWNTLTDWDGNIVISLQRELLGDEGVSHYFLGKASVYEIKPFSATELLDLYKMKWKDVSPFTENALRYVAKLARGITRRWLRYLGIILQSWLLDGEKTIPIDAERVQWYLPPDEITNDMDAELSHIFRKSPEGKTNALKVIGLLNSTEELLTQKRVASLLRIGQMECSRIVEKLEDHGYLKREKTKEGKLLKTLL